MRTSNSDSGQLARIGISGSERRAYVDLVFVTIVALAFPLISISIHFIDRVHDFFRDYHMLLLGEYITNFVFLYVCGLLWFTHRRWTIAERERKELEDIVSGINPDTLIVVDKNGQIITCNDSIQRMFGYTPAEAVNENVEKLYSANRSNPTWQHMYQRVEKEGFHMGPATGKRKDGTILPLEVITGTITSRKRAVLLLRDVTEREKAENAIRGAYAELNQIFDTAADGMCVVNQELKVVRVNKTLLGLLGLTEDEAGGSYCYDLFSCRNRDLPDCSLNRIRTEGRRFERETEIERKDGTRFPCLLTVAPFVDGSGNLVGIIEDLKDITERKAMEDRLRALAVVDDLTGLYNRRGFLAFSDQQVRYSERTRKGFAVFFADMDGLKTINDMYGHAEGDRALEKAAMVLKDTFRKPDIVCRIGGDEFAVIAVEAQKESGSLIVSRLRAAIDRLNERKECSYNFSMSVGWTYYNPEEPCTVQQLLHKADAAMYEEKSAKKQDKPTTNR
jgi:diguanylate cyclase (GGDEF)-like protein/PAS domain S-box-containing protein